MLKGRHVFLQVEYVRVMAAHHSSCPHLPLCVSLVQHCLSPQVSLHKEWRKWKLSWCQSQYRSSSQCLWTCIPSTHPFQWLCPYLYVSLLIAVCWATMMNLFSSSFMCIFVAFLQVPVPMVVPQLVKDVQDAAVQSEPLSAREEKAIQVPASTAGWPLALTIWLLAPEYILVFFPILFSLRRKLWD